LKELETRANEDKGILVDILAREFRVDMLNVLGFNQQLKRVGKQPALLADSNEDGTADFDDLDSLVDYLVDEKMSQQEHNPYRVQIFNENKAMWEDKVSYPDLDTARWQVDTWVKESGELCRVYYNGREIYCPTLSANGKQPHKGTNLPDVKEAFPFKVQMPNADGYVWAVGEGKDLEAAVKLATETWHQDKRTVWIKDIRTGNIVWHSDKQHANPSPNGESPNFTHRPGGR
jgi:hypothetical protein